MSQNSPHIQIMSVSVDAKSAASTTMDITENNGKRFVPLFVVAELTATSLITVGPSFSIGTNSTAFDNIMAITATGITATNAILNKLALGNGAAGTNTLSIAANTTVTLKVTTGAVGTSGTLRVDLIGYYL